MERTGGTQNIQRQRQQDEDKARGKGEDKVGLLFGLEPLPGSLTKVPGSGWKHLFCLPETGELGVKLKQRKDHHKTTLITLRPHSPGCASLALFTCLIFFLMIILCCLCVICLGIRVVCCFAIVVPSLFDLLTKICRWDPRQVVLFFKNINDVMSLYENYLLYDNYYLNLIII